MSTGGKIEKRKSHRSMNLEPEVTGVARVGWGDIGPAPFPSQTFLEILGGTLDFPPSVG